MNARCSIIAFFVLTSSPCFANDYLSGVYCDSGRSILEFQTFEFRKMGVPIANARESFDYLLKDNADAWFFMLESVTELYRNPEEFQKVLKSGGWRELCVKKVRGY